MDMLFLLLSVVVALSATLVIALVARAGLKNRETDGPDVRLAGGNVQVIAQINGPRGMPKPKGDTIEFVPNTGERIAYDCGHEGHVDFLYSIFGQEIETDTDRIRSAHEKCPECIVADMRQDIIRCALCGNFIVPGDGVAVYARGDGIIKKWATRTPDGGYIGCMRWDCCPSGGFFAGHWMGRKGFKPAFAHGSAAAEAMATGKPVFGEIGPTDDED